MVLQQGVIYKVLLKVSYLFGKGGKGLQGLEDAIGETEKGGLDTKVRRGRKALLELAVCEICCSSGAKISSKIPNI